MKNITHETAMQIASCTLAAVVFAAVLALVSGFTFSGTASAQTAATSTVEFRAIKIFDGDDKGFSANDFQFEISGDEIGTVTIGNDTPIELPLGTYTLREVYNGSGDFDPDLWRVKWTGPDVHCTEDSSDNSAATFTVSNPNKDPVNCTAENQYRPGILTIEKRFTATSTDPSLFSFQINGGTETAFDASGTNIVEVGVGAYEVTEVNGTDYSVTYSDGCTGTLVYNDSETCIITNTLDDDGRNGGNNENGTLTIVKKVINDDSGTSVPEDFAYEVTNASSSIVASGSFDTGSATTSTTTVSSLAAGTYSVAETNASGYAASNGCESVEITAGEETVCTITNDDEGNGGGGGHGTSTDEYRIEGYVWHDVDEDEAREEDENDLSGWTVIIENIDDPEDTQSTTTDETGYYYFDVTEGTWKLHEEVMDGWHRTTSGGNGDGTYTVTVPEEDVATLWFPLNLFVTVAHAAVVQTYSGFNFGNAQTSSGGGGDDGGGGGGNPPGGGGSGPKISLSDGGGDDSGGGSGGDGPTPRVESVQTQVVPLGAANAGAGGTDTSNTGLAFLVLALLGSAVGYRLINVS